MSRICENCGHVFHGAYAHPVPIERRDAVTGYVYKFCSQQCANQWVEKHKNAQPPPPVFSAPPKQDDDSRQEERWMRDGGADIQLSSQTGDSHDSCESPKETS